MPWAVAEGISASFRCRWGMTHREMKDNSRSAGIQKIDAEWDCHDGRSILGDNARDGFCNCPLQLGLGFLNFGWCR